mmetsp:Transcript_3973/g.4607  ORF Transcript_3973/g.4607 Transcript_3973/m.4607 type:complete len:108 (+) Transcript_3973:269-592(+)
MYLMSNRHMRHLYLNKNGTQCTLVRHQLFSLWYSEATVDISSFSGVSSILNSKMGIYRLGYSFKGWVRNRDTYMIFRPEFVYDQDVWKLVRTGNHIRTPEYIDKYKY